MRNIAKINILLIVIMVYFTVYDIARLPFSVSDVYTSVVPPFRKEFQSQFSENIISKPEPTKFNLCSTHKDCNPTCCGCYSQEYRSYCTDFGCDQSKFHICLCIEGVCAETDRPVPDI